MTTMPCSVEPSNSFLDLSLNDRVEYLKMLRSHHKDLVGEPFGGYLLHYWADIHQLLAEIAMTSIELMEKQCGKN